MAFVDHLYETNFIEYASYVIKDRAIPYVEDGLKPVQRRILHSLFEMDDGMFNKVANVVGHSMKYHPHGDASIYSALVVLANKEIFIDKQGNFGNIYTGDPPSAARYIECRLTPLAKEVLYNPQITRFEPSYDGRNQEPLAFPAKIPVLLAHGADGIAVGMATKILPHNFIELLQAQIACLRKKPFQVLPDFPTKGLVDVSEYNDGNGKVLVRCRLDADDPKRIVIRDLPYGTTTETLIASVEEAAKKNKIKISSISDFTAEEVEIEIKTARGINSRDIVDALYAFTDCEISISVNMMVIKDSTPQVMNATEVIRYNTERLVEILTAELKIEEDQLKDKLHAKTLEQIFIEKRIYKKIEDKRTKEEVEGAVLKGLEPFKKEIKREVTADDVETLLKIPIRRISLYDIEKANKEMREIRKRLREIKESLDNIISYSADFLRQLINKYKKQYPRQTEICAFEKKDVREVAKRDLKLRYDKKTGYLGTNVNGDAILEVSPYDRVLVIRKTGAYSVINVPDKLFVDKGMAFCGFIDKDRVYNIIYKDRGKGQAYIKRCAIEKFILEKGYSLIPEGAQMLDLTTDSGGKVLLDFKPKPRLRALSEEFPVEEYPVRGNKAGGIRLSTKEIKKGKFI